MLQPSHRFRTAFWCLFTAPFSHAGFGHLSGYTFVFLLLSDLVLDNGVPAYLSVWICTILFDATVWLLLLVIKHGRQELFVH